MDTPFSLSFFTNLWADPSLTSPITQRLPILPIDHA